MVSIKAAFKAEQDLHNRLDVVWDDLGTKLREETVEERQQMVKYRTPMIASGIIAVVLFFMSDFSGTWYPVLFSFATAGYAGFNAYHWIKASEAYTKKLNARMYALVFRFFELTGDYLGDDGEVIEKNTAERIKEILKDSELITENSDMPKVGDVFETTYEGNKLLVAELDVTRTEGSGKNRRVVQIFKGLFAEYELHKTLTGTTFVSTEGDTYGFGHRDFWSRITGKSKVEETELEWNDFEKDLHVATTSGTEARYILTPDFMQDLHEWWQKKKRNIRIVFAGTTARVLFPDRHIHMGSMWSVHNTVGLKRYALSIIEPLWHVLLLLEDVDRRFD